MTKYYEVITKRHYRQETWADVSGYETKIVRTDIEFPSWVDKQEEYDNAVELQDLIVNGLKANNPYGYTKIETVSGGIKRLVSWSSIGD